MHTNNFMILQNLSIMLHWFSESDQLELQQHYTRLTFVSCHVAIPNNLVCLVIVAPIGKYKCVSCAKSSCPRTSDTLVSNKVHDIEGVVYTEKLCERKRERKGHLEYQRTAIS